MAIRRTAALMSTLALTILGGTSGWASDLTIPNTFVADTKAVAADVNANFSAVEAAVDDNNARITQNTADIITNTASIATGVANTATNTANIVTNTAAIATNGSNIAANTTAISVLQQNGSKIGVACAGNDVNDVMVRVGPLCVDKYEASLWDSATGGSAINANTCADNGNDCAVGATKIFARSVAGTVPDSNISWFQAQQACATSGKRLLTNAEWQMAAAGTPDPGATADTANNCNTNSGAVVNTGASNGGSGACVSNWGTFDMIGNLNEWTADWTHGANGGTWSPSTGTAGSDYGADTMSGINPAATQGTNSSNFPGAIYRGGAYAGGASSGVFALVANVAPSFKGVNVGFRCGR